MRPATVALFLAGVLLATPAVRAADRFNLPQGPGRDLVYGQCQTCHDLQSIVDSSGIGHGAWNAVLDNMRNFGLRISDAQRSKILDYLATYLGPNPPSAAAAPAEQAAAADGAQLFQDVCAACHQPEGQGKHGEFPPLAGNSDLFLSHDFPVLVVLNGLTGPIKVEGDAIDNTMPPLDFLTDEQIAAAVDYVRSQWGNEKLAPSDMTDITAADVKKAREKKISDADVHKLRQSLLP